ncbi:hypothetical protein G4D82_00915 [Flavobacterium sp. CYK-4]|uniref:hypothetical protein n=1 Tax=Flavobacterium lotistagni TaxID=2709660 RepID=UPI00140AE1A6|nr:hypothetical protein [Flavobacterium lotistagni]NHM05768.1 hypothetical protein [Flavobacterium lotistagni]
MEPNKLDKKFRKALQEREIAPTPAAWDRLDAMLTVAEEKKATTNYNWLYIAATLLGFIAIAVVFLSKTEQLVDVRRDEVVYQNESSDTVKDSLQPENKTDLVLLPKTKEVVAETQSNSETQSPRVNKSFIQNQNLPEKRKMQNPIANQQNDAIATHNHSEINQPSKNEQPNQLFNTINQPNQQAVAQLEVAPKIGKTPIKVNASNLLSEVNGELELSFREKVINRLDRNYQNVKVALANRNQNPNE